MTGTTTQPSQVATEEAQRPDDTHVVTDDLDFFQRSSETPEQKPKEAAAPDKSKESGQKPDESATSDDDKSKEQEPVTGKRAERRIAKLSRDLARMEGNYKQSESQRKKLEDELAELRTSQASAAKKPELKDFDSPEEYAEAFADWKATQASAAKPADSRKPADKKPAAASPDEDEITQDPPAAVKEFQERGKKDLGDKFVHAISKDGTAVDEHMGEYLMDSDHGPAIYVYLSEHQDESVEIFNASTRDKINMLDALEAQAEAGKLLPGEGEVNQDKDKGKGQQRGGRQTQAKEPPSDTSTAGDARPPDPENESMDEYAARRSREEAERRGFRPNT